MLPGPHSQNLSEIMTRVVGLGRNTVSAFGNEAYGACLALVYKRALPLGVRNDLHMTFMSRGLLWGGKDAARVDPALRNARQAFYRQLIRLNQAAFVFASFDAVSNPDNQAPYEAEPLLFNPWALSDSEFAEGVIFLRRGKMPDIAQPNEYDAEDMGKKIGGIGVSIAKDELTDFIADFIQDGAKGLGSVLRTSVRFAARASVISAFIETLMDIASHGRVEAIKTAFKRDEPRRVFLKSVGWGDYVAPEQSRPPTIPAYTRGLISANP